MDINRQSVPRSDVVVCGGGPAGIMAAVSAARLGCSVSVIEHFGFFGGAIGALLGMKAFRHKTKHWYFWFFNIFGLLWQIALPVLVLLYQFGVI